MSASVVTSRLRPGDWVEVRSADEILHGLDTTGTLDGLPFMPEMVEFCGKRFRVFQRVVQAVVDGASLGNYSESFVREFKNNDVVLLEGLRCSGVAHGGCQRGCMVFWKEAWLRKVGAATSQPEPLPEGCARLRARLKTTTGPETYFCQSSEFVKATNPLSQLQRFKKCFAAVRAGNCSLPEMVRQLMVWTWWKVHRKLLGEYPRGTQKKTPAEVLALQPGEGVEVKPLDEIIATLDEKGKNRGLHFSPDMIPCCGRRYSVRSRADKFIAEGTGEMRQFRNTVILEGALCDSATYSFGGCPRSDFLYWREIWLKRVQPKGSIEDGAASPAVRNAPVPRAAPTETALR